MVVAATLLAPLRSLTCMGGMVYGAGKARQVQGTTIYGIGAARAAVNHID